MDQFLMPAGLAALFAAFLVAALAVSMRDRAADGVARSLRTIDQAYRIPGAASGPAGRSRGRLFRRATALARTLTPAAAIDKLSRRLDQAGNPGWLSVEALLGYKGLLLFAGAGLGLMLGLLLAGPLGTVVWIACGAVAGLFAPNLLVAHLAQERQQQITRTLPDIMDTLVVTVEAGLGFEAALAQVVNNGRGPMVGEFARVLHEMQIGRPRVEALREMGARTTVGELRAFASAVVQATTLGVPLANVLRQQAGEMRLRRRQRAEEQAQKVPVKILFPMVLCMLPAMFIVVLGPGVIRLIESFGGR